MELETAPIYGLKTLLAEPERFDSEEFVDGLDTRDAALLAHLSSFQKKWLSVRDRLILQKREYDQSEPAYKLPFALKDYDPKSLRWIIENTFSFSLTHGCTGGCVFCGLAALLTSSKNVEGIPLEQAKCFFDTWLGSLSPEEQKKAIAVGSFYMYEDSDPFDYPHLEELMYYLHRRYEVAPHLTTVMPAEPTARAMFDRMTGIKAKNVNLAILKVKLNCLKELHSYERITSDQAGTIIEKYKYKALAVRRHMLTERLLEDPLFPEFAADPSAFIDQIPQLIERLTAEETVLSKEMQGQADPGVIRVSAPRHRAHLIKGNDPEKHYFDAAPKEFYEKREPYPSGVPFYESGQEVGGYGIHCINGVAVSPFGVFNKIGGRITRNYPQGRIIVPFKGFTEKPELAHVGSDLGRVLEHVVALRSPHKGQNNTFVEVLIYDGSQVRNIHFDDTNYRVISDRVVQGNVSAPNEVNVQYSKPQLGEVPIESLLVPFEEALLPTVYNVLFAEAIRQVEYYISDYRVGDEERDMMRRVGVIPWLRTALQSYFSQDQIERILLEYKQTIEKKFRQNLFNNDNQDPKFVYKDDDAFLKARLLKQALELGVPVSFLAKDETPYVSEILQGFGFSPQDLRVVKRTELAPSKGTTMFCFDFSNATLGVHHGFSTIGLAANTLFPWKSTGLEVCDYNWSAGTEFSIIKESGQVYFRANVGLPEAHAA